MEKGEVIARVSAPGKVILFGEHSVVHGRLAVAASASDLRLGVKVELLPASRTTTTAAAGLELALPNVAGAGCSFHFPLDDLLRELGPLVGAEGEGETGRPPRAPSSDTLAALEDLLDAAKERCGRGGWVLDESRAREALLPMLFICSCLLLRPLQSSGRGRVRVTAQTLSLPIGAGLGSSAALCVATSTAAWVARHSLLGKTWHGEPGCEEGLECPSARDLETINGWAFAGEAIIHGNPSGIDNTVSCYGGCLSFQRQPQQSEAMPNSPQLSVLLTNTLVKDRNTRSQVKGVGELLKRYPEAVSHLFDSIDAISRRFLSGGTALSEKEVGELMSMNHHALCALGVGHPRLSAVYETSALHGCSGKLTGAGGGGCMITLLPQSLGKSQVDALERDLISQGFECLRSALGGAGVIVHKPVVEGEPEWGCYDERRRSSNILSKKSERSHKALTASLVIGFAGLIWLTRRTTVR